MVDEAELLALVVRLLDDVRDALVRGGEARGLRKRGEHAHGLELLRQQVEPVGLGFDAVDFHDGGDLVGGVAALAHEVGGALADERPRLRDDRVDPFGGDVQYIGRLANERRELHRKRRLRLHQDAHDAERGAAQRERVLVARGHLPDREHSHQRVEAIGERDGDARIAHRQRVAGKPRPIVLLDGARDRRLLAVGFRVVTADHALQLGEFAHHQRHEIGLGEERGAVRPILARLATRQRFLDRHGELAQPLHPLRLRAQLVVVDDGRELRHAIGEPRLLVGLEEEARVGQAWTDDPLVALHDGAGVGQAHVGDDHEARQQLAAFAQQRKILLVLLHREHEALLRHREELLVERAEIDLGPLHQRGDFVQQRRGRLVAVRELRALLAQLRRDRGAPHREIRDDRTFVLEASLVLVGVRERDVARPLEAVAVRHASGLQAQRLHGHDVGSVQRDQPVRGPDELHGGPTVGELVAHHLRDRQLRDRIVQRLLQRRGERHGGRGRIHEEHFRLPFGAPVQRRHVGSGKAQRFQLLRERLRGLAIGVERNGGGHELDLHRPRLRFALHVRDARGKPPRRGEGVGRRALGKKLALREALRERRCEGLAQLRQRLGRKLLAEHLDQQRRRAHAAAFASIGNPRRSRDS